MMHRCCATIGLAALACLPQVARAQDTAPATWVARSNAELVLLDKVSARASPLAANLGKPLRYGSLTIVVGACDVRPSDQPADATAWLDITDSNPGGPAFHGWILKAEPAVSGLQHPLYDIRLAGCR